MPYDNETGHSYFKSDEDAERWLSYYAPEAYYYTFPIDTPMHNNSPFIPKDPSATTSCLCNAGASVYKKGDVTGSTSGGWGTSIPGLSLRSALKTFNHRVHCNNIY